METIAIQMLGDFTLRCGENTISDSGNRAKKLWSMLAYLLCHRDRPVPPQSLIDLMWGEDSASANPENVLRITLHRLRAQLDLLYPGAGRELILRRDGGYLWNTEIPIALDYEEFENLCRPASNQEQYLQNLQKALSLYRGSFLPRQSSEMWAIPISTHMQNLFLQASLEAAELLSQRDRHSEAAAICRRAAQWEPYHEVLHQKLMQELSAAGDPKGAAAVYETLSRRLFDDFGIRPSEDTRQAYRASAHSPEDRTLPMDEVLEHIQEAEVVYGAMECDYDYFKILCFSESRAMERSGNVTHIALVNLVSDPEKPLTKRAADNAMKLLGTHLCKSLRRGDTVSRCSVSQYIIMLPNANYENSCMVCRRILNAFHREHPHLSAKINFLVQPLSPSLLVP